MLVYILVLCLCAVLADVVRRMNIFSSTMPITRASKNRDAKAAELVGRSEQRRQVMESLNNMQLADCNQQSLSPLFSKIPGEIRNNIFNMALTQYENKEKPFAEDAFWYRPGFTCEAHLDTTLLRTCRRIYLESRHLPAESCCLTLWFEGEDRRPSGYTNGVYNRMMEKYNFAGCKRAQIFAQMYWLEGFGLNKWFGPKPNDPKLAKIFRLERLEELTVTIRHTDWWWWEDNHPLQIEDHWIEKLETPDSLKVFNLELEVPMRKKNELDTIVKSLIKDLVFKRHDGVTFSTKQTEPVVSTWTGSATFEGHNYEPLIPRETRIHDADGNEVEGDKPEKIQYHVLTLSWRPVY